MIGQIVCSKKGRDKGCFSVIVAESEKSVFICDGKHRPLERPKQKNVKHLSFTGTVLGTDCFQTNKRLKKSLAVYRDTAAKGGRENV